MDSAELLVRLADWIEEGLCIIQQGHTRADLQDLKDSVIKLLQFLQDGEYIANFQIEDLCTQAGWACFRVRVHPSQSDPDWHWQMRFAKGRGGGVAREK